MLLQTTSALCAIYFQNIKLYVTIFAEFGVLAHLYSSWCCKHSTSNNGTNGKVGKIGTFLILRFGVGVWDGSL